VRTDPLRGLPTPLRLWAAAFLCVLPLGFLWSGEVTPGVVLFGDCSYTEGYYCVPDQYLPGSAKYSFVSQAPIRVFLIAAAIAFVVCAARARTVSTRAVARLGCAAVAGAIVLAAGHGSVQVLACVLGAFVLVGPLVVRPARVLASGPRPG
jgi:hypothetical protein